MMGVAGLHSVTRKSLTEKAVFQPRLGVDEGLDLVATWGKSFQHGENSKCKGPGAWYALWVELCPQIFTC